MRHISFQLTTRQVRERSKFVTRRLRWFHAVPGMLLQGVEKSMGRRHGEPLVLLPVIRVADVRREPLSLLFHDPKYGRIETALEGFPELDGFAFASMFASEMRCDLSEEITRIAFQYVD